MIDYVGLLQYSINRQCLGYAKYGRAFAYRNILSISAAAWFFFFYLLNVRLPNVSGQCVGYPNFGRKFAYRNIVSVGPLRGAQLSSIQSRRSNR